MYPRFPWEMVADPLRSAEHTLGTTGQGIYNVVKQTNNKPLSNMFVLPHYVMQAIYMLGTEMGGICPPYRYLHGSP
jgi:hypothetical protein